MQNVTAIIVSYNTQALLQAAYESLRRFYPLMPVVIVDNSDLTNPCYRYARKIAYGPTKCVSNNTNLGHGPGMVLGISCVETEYFLLMDSDVTIDIEGVLEKMFYPFTKLINLYGCGQIVKVDKNGMNENPFLEYLHPHFALIKKAAYDEYSPIINHGAPLIRAMHSLRNRHIPQKDFLMDFPLTQYITHHERGTRKLNPRGFHPRFWDKV